MTVKVLFFDTSALIKRFVDEPGTKTMKWLTSSETRVAKSLHFNINEQVCIEFLRKIEHFSYEGRISQEKANDIISQFERSYRGKYFHVIGQRIISNVKEETSLDDILRNLGLEKGKNDGDGIIFQSIVNALACLGGKSHPILVTCDKKFAKLVKKNGYRIINPETQSVDEIIEIIT